MPVWPERIIYHCLINKSRCSFPQGRLCGGRGRRENLLSHQQLQIRAHSLKRPCHLGLPYEPPDCFLCQSVLRGHIAPYQKVDCSSCVYLGCKDSWIGFLVCHIPISGPILGQYVSHTLQMAGNLSWNTCMLKKGTIISGVNCLHVANIHIAHRWLKIDR